MDKKPIIERPCGCSCTRWALLKGTCSSHCNYCPWSGYQPEPNDRYDMERKPPAEQVPSGMALAMADAPSIADAIQRAKNDSLEEAAKVCDSRLGSPGNFNGTPDEIRDREAEEIAREIRALKPSPASGEQINADAAAAKQEADR